MYSTFNLKIHFTIVFHGNILILNTKYFFFLKNMYYVLKQVQQGIKDKIVNNSLSSLRA